MILVRHGKGRHGLTVEDAGGGGATVLALQQQIESQLGVPLARQKLICKGRVLARDATLEDGAEVMLLSTASDVTPAQDAARDAAAARLSRAAECRQARREAAASRSVRSGEPSHDASSAMESRAHAWQASGIVAASGRALDSLAGLVRTLDGLSPMARSRIRCLDIGDNRLTTVLPGALQQLPSLQRLRCSHNRLGSDGVPWEALRALTQLSHARLDHNQLRSMPERSLAGLTSLQLLNVSHNCLTSLPADIGELGRLRELSCSHNALAALPASLGCCSGLVHIDATHNELRQLPVELGSLARLRSLIADNNHLADDGVPAAIFEHCTELRQLSVTNNPICMPQLREIKGYADYEARRKDRFDKAIQSELAVGFSDDARYA